MDRKNELCSCCADSEIERFFGFSDILYNLTIRFLFLLIYIFKYLIMLITTNYWVALGLTVITMLTWGSNKIAVKYLTYPVSLYTIDFFTWVFIFHVILGFTLGADWFPPEKGVGMISNFKEIFSKSTVRFFRLFLCIE